MDEIETLKRMYDRFNARDIDGVLNELAEDVEWANGMEGGHVRGRREVGDYWRRQWAQISPRVEPLSFEVISEGEIAATVRQELFDLSGQPLTVAGGLQSQLVGHVYRFEAGKVVRFDLAKDVRP